MEIKQKHALHEPSASMPRSHWVEARETETERELKRLIRRRKPTRREARMFRMNLISKMVPKTTPSHFVAFRKC